MNKKITAYTIVILFFTGVITMGLAFTMNNPRYDLIWESRSLLYSAFFTTIWISMVSLTGALIIGFVLFVMNRSSIYLLQAFSKVFSEIIMGTPLLVMIFIVVYPFGTMIWSTNKLWLGIFAMIFYNAPYIANAYESTAAVVTEDQYVVMDLYNFKWWQKYKYIILPQMLRPFIPSLVNNLSSVIKSSALLNIIAVGEITYTTIVIANKNYAVIEGYYIMWIMYLCVTIPLSVLAKYVARKVAN